MAANETRKEQIEREAKESLGIPSPVVEQKEPTKEDEFTDEQRAADRVQAKDGVSKPSFTSLLAHMERFGPEGVVESAMHLTDEQYAKLKAKAKAMKYDRKARKWAAS